MLISIIVTIIVLACAGLAVILKSRNMHIWISTYVKDYFTSNKEVKQKHIYFCLADHYEPYFNQVDQKTARTLVDNWVKSYRAVASKHSDSDGNPPQHSYFYPIEEYDEYVLNQLKSICEEGLGDVDIHLHHDDDTAENLEKTMNDFKQMLFDKHGLLRKNDEGEIVYGFIHGNWALDNSRPDGKWCGVKNEIDVLLKTGCVYDMTMPSAPSDTQTSTINRIYWAQQKNCVKSHDKGEEVVTGQWKKDLLLMIQGPLKLNWKSRRFGLIPRIESSELSGDAPPTKQRIQLWEDANITIQDAEEHVFIKLYTHGLQNKNSKMFFEDGGFENLWSELEEQYKNKSGYTLHYVNAWQMYQKIENLVKNKQ